MIFELFSTFLIIKTFLLVLIFMIHLFLLMYCISSPLKSGLMQLFCIKGQGEDYSSEAKSSKDPYISSSK